MSGPLNPVFVKFINKTGGQSFGSGNLKFIQNVNVTAEVICGTYELKCELIPLKKAAKAGKDVEVVVPVIEPSD